MKALSDLFSTDYGLMSIIGLTVIVVGFGYAYLVLKKKMAETSDQPRK